MIAALSLQSKTRSLAETLRLHRFYNSCQEFESWMEDKENILNTFSTDANNLGVVQAKYEVKSWTVSNTKKHNVKTEAKTFFNFCCLYLN